MQTIVIQAGALLLLGFVVACEVRTPIQDPVTKCYAQMYDDLWDQAILDVDVSSPDRCPFLIPVGRSKDTVFEGIVIGDPYYVQGNGYGDANYNSVSEVSVYNWANQIVIPFGIPPTNFFTGNNPPRSQLRVTYAAGTLGYQYSYQNKGIDRAWLRVSLRDANKTVTQGYADLSFTYEPTVSLLAPTFVTGSSTISLSTSTKNYRTPLKYRWWKNGSLMLTTGSGFTTSGPIAGTSVTYKVEVTDADGDKAVDDHKITASLTGGGGGGGGGGCLVSKEPTQTAGKERGDMEACPTPP